MIHPFLAKKLENIKQICKDHSVKRLYVFGSVCSSHFNNNSDIDLLLSFNENLSPEERGEKYWKLLYILEDLLQRKVDIITEGSLKNPFFIEELNEKKITIYE